MNKIRSLVMILYIMVLCVDLHAAMADEKKIEEYCETARFEEARELIRQLPSSGKQAYWLSRTLFYAGDYSAAKEEIAHSKDNTYLALGQYYGIIENITRDFKEYSSEHFRFRAAGADTVLARYALDGLEKAYTEIGGDLNCFPEDKILVEVYPSKETFSAASTLSKEILDKSGTVGICKFNRLMILSPQALPLGYLWQDTLAHEYAHLLVNRISAAKCPLWLHEGIARYCDTRWRSKAPACFSADGENRLSEARKAKRLIPFKKMHPSLVYLDSQAEISLAFAEVASAVKFLNERYGGERVGRLLNEMAVTDISRSFKKALGLSLSGFETEWKTFLKDLPLKESPGALSDQATFNERKEEEFIGADLRGIIRLGDRMRQAGRPDAALIQYEKALAVEPANPVILLKTAKTLLVLGDKDRAQDTLALAIEKNPQYVTPYQVLGEEYFKEGNYEKTVEVLGRALSINPFHPDTHRYLYKAFLALGDYNAARYELNTTVILDPSDHEAKVLLDRFQ